MADLVVIVPSRGRPEAARELSKAFRETCTADTRLLLALDKDDPAHDEYPDVWTITGTENRNMVDALNLAANYLMKGGTSFIGTQPFAVGFMGDDHRPRRAGWDQAYLDALREMGTGIVYGNDLFQGERLPTQVAMTADIVRTLGFMAPPVLTHLAVDNFWKDLGQRAGCLRYLPDVIVEHMHPVAGKADWDEGYKRVNAPEMYQRDLAAYQRWSAANLTTCALRVRTLRGRS